MFDSSTFYTQCLQQIGTPDAVLANGTDDPPTERQRSNAHVHLPPNFSAFETAQQALDLAAAQEVRVLGASNYYDYAVYRELAEGASERGIFPLFGIEIISLVDELLQKGVKINDPGNAGKMYLCGKGITRFDPLPDDAQRLLNVIRNNDSARMAAMTATLAARVRSAGLDAPLDAEAIKDRIVARHGSARDTVYLQERHIAQAFQEVIFASVPEAGRAEFLQRLFGSASKNPGDAVTVQNEIRSHLLKAGKPAFVPDTFVDFDHAYALVLALGGIPCYPTLADGVQPICGYEQEVDALIADLKARGIWCAEFIPNRNAPDVLLRYVRAMREAGLFVTAGTEHNTLELLPIEPTCVGGQPIPEEAQQAFWEGACVVAAHQFLMWHGLPGFVDDTGRLNPRYETPQARIEAFSRLGAAVIARFQRCTAATPAAS